jgi:nickel-dependent lactate racemase
MKSHTLQLAYGHTQLEVDITNVDLLGFLTPGQVIGSEDDAKLLSEALAYPVGTPPLRELAQVGQKIVIVTSDLTRPCPSERLLPFVLDELEAANVSMAEVMIVIALGLHRAMTEEELQAAVGPDVYRRVRVINHDPDDIVRLGTTTAGTQVEFFRPVVDADFRICLGNLELHYFAGYSGGAKAIFPGCASDAAVRANHAMMVRSEASSGRLGGNPLRDDIEEAVAMLGVDFMLNVVMGDNHRIVGAYAGELTAAHRQGCKLVALRSQVSIPRLADIVLVSTGGYPKDINLYQAHKALENAVRAVRPGGIVILAAECIEGLGNRTFESWVKDAGSPDELLARLERGFVLGGHKAAAIAKILKHADVHLVSELPDELVRTCGLVPQPDLKAALETAIKSMGPEAGLIAMPQGLSVLPKLNA